MPKRTDLTKIMLIGSGKLAGPWAIAGGSTVRGARRSKDVSYFDRLTGFGTAPALSCSTPPLKVQPVVPGIRSTGAQPN